MPNPSTTATGGIEGAWLLPYVSGILQSSLVVWINADEHGMEMPGRGTVFSPPSRPTAVVQLEEAKQEQGSIAGLIEAGHGQTATTWLTRFRTLHRDQERYDVQLQTPRFTFFKVTLEDGYSINEITASEAVYDVSFSYLSVTDQRLVT